MGHPQVTVAEIIDRIAEWYPLSLAADWDVNGLAVGHLSQPVHRVLLAVDPTFEVVMEAHKRGAQLLVTHHPLLLRGVHSVAANTPKGAVVDFAIKHKIALYNAHTNADSAADGVADVLAQSLGMSAVEPLEPVVSGAGGLGRWGRVMPTTARGLAIQLDSLLPRTVTGVTIAGDPNLPVETVALLPGAGDSLLNHAVVQTVDAFITADLRHHPVSEARELARLSGGKPVLIGVSHFASESLYLGRLADRIAQEFAIAAEVSNRNTDPWTVRIS